MDVIHKVALYSHIILGSFALILFWLPLYFKKGSRNHNRSGRAYALSMYAVSLLGILCCALVLFDPVLAKPRTFNSPEQMANYIEQSRIFSMFLLMLSLLVLVSIYHGERVLKVKANNHKLKAPLHLGLLVALFSSALFSLIVGMMNSQTLLIIFACISLFVAASMTRYIFKSKVNKNAWIFEHLGSMLGSGIGVYTAFSAVGGRSLLSKLLGEQAVLISWVMPSLIGTLAIVLVTRYFEKKLGYQKQSHNG